MAVVTLTIQHFDGIEDIEDLDYCTRTGANTFQIEDTNLHHLMGDIGAGDFGSYPDIFVRRLKGAIEAHGRAQGWHKPDSRLKSPDKVGADKLFDAMRYVWHGENVRESRCHGVEVRHFDGTVEMFEFPSGPRENIWGLVDEAHALGEGWKDTSSWACFDNLLSHGK